MRAGSRWHPVVSAMLTIVMCGAAVLGMCVAPGPAHAVTISGVPLWNQHTIVPTSIADVGCAATSVAMICNYYGSGKTLQQSIDRFVAAGIISSGGWVLTRSGLSAAVGGTCAYRDRISPADLTLLRAEIDAGRPVEAWDDSLPHHYVIVGYSGSTFYINDPGTGTYKANPYRIDGYFRYTGTHTSPVPHYNPIAPGDPGFTKGGLTSGWTSIGGGYYGTGLYTYCGGSTTDNWGKWKFDLSKLDGSRKYNVDAYIPSAYHSTTKADYHIATSTGVQHKVLNQSAYSNEWADLGNYSFTSGADWMVYLDDVTGETALSKYIAFDAVRLTPYFNFNYSAGTGGTLSGTAAQSVIKGGNGTQVTAVPKAGYRFVRWSDNVTSAARTDTNAQADKTLTATFAAISMPSVHRFYNTRLGVHFYTADEAEKANTVANLGGTYTYEGVAYGVNPSSNTQPLHRFYNKRVGVHFYTASETEKANTINTLGDTYAYEGVAYNVSAANGTGRTAVHRFYNKRTGTHFYTSDEAERQNIVNTLGAIYTYEGVGFYLAP